MTRSYQKEEIGMRSSELGDVRQVQPLCEGLVEPDTEVPLSTEQQENEHSNVQHSHQGWGGGGWRVEGD